MMVERLKHEGTSHSSSDLLKICVKMGGAADQHRFCPGAFLLLFFLKTWHTHLFADLNCSCGGEGGCWSCVNGCVERCSGRMWG